MLQAVEIITQDTGSLMHYLRDYNDEDFGQYRIQLHHIYLRVLVTHLQPTAVCVFQYIRDNVTTTYM